MPRRAFADLELWEQRLMGTAAKWNGWSIAKHGDRIRIRLRQNGKAVDSVLLPKVFTWSEASEPDATLWIRQVRNAWTQGSTLKAAVEAVTQTSDKHGDDLGFTWAETVESFRDSVMTGRNQIRAETWRDNYQPYLKEALRLLGSSNKPKDGFTLLKRTLQKWEGKPSSRFACCLALRNWMDHCISRFGVPGTWAMSKTDIAELRGRPPVKRTKAVLTDEELLELIAAVEQSNPAWAAVIKTLTATGCRPVELSFITPRKRDDGLPGLWCSHRKISGPNRCDERWLEELPLFKADGTKVTFNLAEQLNGGSLPWPVGRDGKPRKLDGHHVELFLKRQQSWRDLVASCEARGEWCRSYSFRDSFSTRAHRLGIETAQICRVMGHGLQAHSRAYRSASDASARDAFDI